jgi:hypothetical protein
MKQAILSTAYLGPVSYYAVLLQSDEVLIEQYDSYHKQTYRNRCRILGANGPLDLVIPIVKNSGVKTLVKDCRIDNSTRWQNNHWRSLFSAYNSSPFFEYYAHLLEPFYKNKRDFLIDFNTELMELMVDLLQVRVNYSLTDIFEKGYSPCCDFRDSISPKSESDLPERPVQPIQYTQTFSEKFGFIPDLSVVDLLFNCGPESESILLK